MKKRIITITILTLTVLLTLSACAPKNAQNKTIKIGITGESENAIWAPVKQKLANDGINIEIVNFADYTLLNGALNDSDIDLNAFQHYGFFENELREKGYKLAAIGDTYISAMSIYSSKLSSVSELKDGDKVAVPGDSQNQGRALWVAQGAGLIKLGEMKNDAYDISCIAENPLNLVFVEVDASQIPALLPDVAIGIINCNYALDFGLSPNDDAIFYDDVAFYPDKRYANLIAAREADANNETYLKIVAAYQSESVEQVYRTEFEGAYLPAWK